MKINNNISAVITNKQLLGTESALAASMERLSSGLKINHASDNPSGIAISGKMRAQIKGLDQASQNSSDGTSVLQIVDGALGEVTDMLQRMRELAVQAANGTNSRSEKEACQLEIASLREEIDRVSSTTEFNTKSLLDGSLDARVYTDKENVDNVSRTYVSDSVPEGIYKLSVDQPATRAEYATGISVANLVGKTGSVQINGSTAEINASMTETEIKATLRDAAEYGECVFEERNGEIVFQSAEYGAHASIDMIQSFDTDAFPGVPNQKTTKDAKAEVMGQVGTDAVVTLNTDPDESAFSQKATVGYDGNKITITDTNGFKMSMLLEEDFFNQGANKEIEFSVTDVGIMDLQIGANEGQTMQLRIPATDIDNLYLDNINVATVNGAKKTMSSIDDAMTKINEIRSKIGAYENRLDYTVSSLDLTQENMTSALSRIEDVDMAEEMVEYTKNNVLQQAGTSALSQANSLPELALQMLGNR